MYYDERTEWYKCKRDKHTVHTCVWDDKRSDKCTIQATNSLPIPEPSKIIANKPRWIPMTERLPDAYEEVLLLFPHNQAAGFIDRDGYWSVYSGDGFYTEVAENEPKPTHWTKKLPEPPKEDEPDVQSKI